MSSIYKRFLFINIILLLSIYLFIITARNTKGFYSAITYISLGILFLLFCSTINLIMLIRILKSNDKYSTIALFYLAATLIYLGLFSWIFIDFSSQMKGFHPTMSP